MNKFGDNIIAEKLNELNSLPESYQPNIDSKWQIIEESLNESGKERKFYFRNLIRIAAIFLIVFISVAIWMMNKTERKSNEKNSLAGNYEIKSPSIILNSLVANKNEKHQNRKQINPQENIFVNAVDEVPVNISGNIAETKLVVNEEHSVSVVKKKRRYVQVDFNDPVTTLVSNNKMNQTFSVKVGIGKASGPVSEDQSPTLRLSKPF